MEIQLENDGSILLRAETEFEREFVNHYCPHGKGLTAFKKCGVTSRDIVGLKIKPYEGEDNETEE